MATVRAERTTVGTTETMCLGLGVDPAKRPLSFPVKVGITFFNNGNGEIAMVPKCTHLKGGRCGAPFQTTGRIPEGCGTACPYLVRATSCR